MEIKLTSAVNEILKKQDQLHQTGFKQIMAFPFYKYIFYPINNNSSSPSNSKEKILSYNNK